MEASNGTGAPAAAAASHRAEEPTFTPPQLSANASPPTSKDEPSSSNKRSELDGLLADDDAATEM